MARGANEILRANFAGLSATSRDYFDLDLKAPDTRVSDDHGDPKQTSTSVKEGDISINRGNDHLRPISNEFIHSKDRPF